MTNEEAIKYLIAPVATTTRPPSGEYLKQKEAYELAIEALKDIERLEEENHRNFVNSQHIISVLIEENKKLREGKLADEIWKLYEKYQSHLATQVLEFGDELKELLGKYQRGGAE